MFAMYCIECKENEKQRLFVSLFGFSIVTSTTNTFIVFFRFEFEIFFRVGGDLRFNHRKIQTNISTVDF